MLRNERVTQQGGDRKGIGTGCTQGSLDFVRQNISRVKSHKTLVRYIRPRSECAATLRAPLAPLGRAHVTANAKVIAAEAQPRRCPALETDMPVRTLGES